MIAKISAVLHSLLPASVYGIVRGVYRRLRSTLRRARRSTTAPITLEKLQESLRKAGIQPGDTVMVHSSMSRIGNVDGGVETVIRSFIETVGPKGTVVMPCYGSAEEVQQGMQEGRIVDLRTARSNTGMVTEVFRTTPGVRRSSHPFSSVCAWGRHRDYVITDHAASPYVCHKSSPIARIRDLNATIVGIGVPAVIGFGVTHLLEEVDDDFPFPVHSPPFTVTYIQTEGNEVIREVYRYDPVRAQTRFDRPGGHWIRERLTEHLTRRGICRWFTYGDAEAWMMNAQPLYEEFRRLVDKGITGYLTREEWLAMNEGDESIDSW